MTLFEADTYYGAIGATYMESGNAILSNDVTSTWSGTLGAAYACDVLMFDPVEVVREEYSSWCMDTSYTDFPDRTVKVVALAEDFTEAEAPVEGAIYAEVVGRMPYFLRTNLYELHIMSDEYPFGGSSLGNLSFYTA